MSAYALGRFMRDQRAQLVFLLGFCLLYARPFLNQFGTLPGYVAVGLGLLLCSYCLVMVLPYMEVRGYELALVLAAGTYFGLTLLLLVVGEPASDDRALWLAGAQQFLLVTLLLFFKNLEQSRIALLYILFAFLLLQSALSIAQYTYYAFGVGLPIQTEEYQEFFLVTGALGNANDNSVSAVSTLIALYALSRKRNHILLVFSSTLLVGSIVWITLSRSMALVFLMLSASIALSLVAQASHLQKRHRHIVGVVAATAMLGILIGIVVWGLRQESDVDRRSSERVDSLAFFLDEYSVYARLQPYMRLGGLAENPWGTLLDLDYSSYFRTGDDPLMQTNPHSYIAENGFLYGILGLLIAITTICAIATGILNNHELPMSLRCSAIVALGVCQGVPSSIIASPLFFVPFVCAMCPSFARPLSR